MEALYTQRQEVRIVSGNIGNMKRAKIHDQVMNQVVDSTSSVLGPVSSNLTVPLLDDLHRRLNRE
jgi:hypothetical protein